MATSERYWLIKKKCKCQNKSCKYVVYFKGLHLTSWLPCVRKKKRNTHTQTQKSHTCPLSLTWKLHCKSTFEAFHKREPEGLLPLIPHHKGTSTDSTGPTPQAPLTDSCKMVLWGSLPRRGVGFRSSSWFSTIYSDAAPPGRQVFTPQKLPVFLYKGSLLPSERNCSWGPRRMQDVCSVFRKNRRDRRLRDNSSMGVSQGSNCPLLSLPTSLILPAVTTWSAPPAPPGEVGEMPHGHPWSLSTTRETPESPIH